MADMIKLTGLWRQESKSGGSYLSGLVSPTSKLLVLPNRQKKDAKEPDYIAFLAPGKDAGDREDADEKKQGTDPFAF